MSDAVRLNSVKDVVARTTLSRSKVYEEMASGRLQSVKVGRRRLITEFALIDYIDSLIETATTDRAWVTPDVVVHADVVQPSTALVQP